MTLEDWDPEASTDETPTGEWRVIVGTGDPGKEPWPSDK